MAASLPTSGERTGATAGEYQSGYYPLDTSADALQAAHTMYQLVGRQDPQQEVDHFPQDGGPAMVRDTDMQMWPNDSEAQVDVSRMQSSDDLPVTDHVGDLLGGYNSHEQGLELEEFNPGGAQDGDSGHEYQQRGAGSLLGNDPQRVILTFLEGEVDAVTITGRDLEGLQRTEFLSDNIIDFYIKYLKGTLSAEHDKWCFFFNSFFFRKLLGKYSESMDIDGCEVDYEQVRTWTGEANLFEKDYIFIPVLRRSHWSLVIICHLSSIVTRPPDDKKVSPCILHLDPLEGKKGMHESFDGQIRSYIIRSWMERYRDSSNRDQMILALACEMKYIRAEVPRQDNGYDCGIFLLHYIELFLRETTSPDFSFATSTRGPRFSSSWLAEKVSAKRTDIQNLILELSGKTQGSAGRRSHIQPVPQPRAWDGDCPRPKPDPSHKPPKGQNKSRKWSDAETSVLLRRMVEGGRVRKGAQGVSHWYLICEEMKSELGAIRSEDQCRLRCDTLLKAYKTMRDYMGKTNKPFSDISREERIGLKLATPLKSEAWFKDLGEICCGGKPDNTKSQKRVKFDPGDGNGLHSSSPHNPSPPQIPSRSSEAKEASPEQVAIPGFCTLDEDLRSTLLSLVQVSLMKKGTLCSSPVFVEELELDEVCQRLAIVQDRMVAEVRNSVIQLWELKLVNFEFISQVYVSFDRGKVPYLKLTDLRVYKKFLEVVYCKNPNFDTYLSIMDGNKNNSVSFPGALLPLSLQRIRVLSLVFCKKIEHIDLSNFPELRCLVMDRCSNLKTVTGWKGVKELGWLEMVGCDSYTDFPPVQSWLFSLREFDFRGFQRWSHQSGAVLHFRQCVRLRRLEMRGTYSLITSISIDLSTLMCLEILTIRSFPALTTIHGLRGVQHSLTTLDLKWCKSLRGVPELGCLKALTHLNMSFSGIEEIPGVQELHLLIALDLDYCRSLRKLPCLGHLKALAFLEIAFTSVEEIPGLENLVSLKTLLCVGSRLKWLPDLHHLPQLRSVDTRGTPFSSMDPSSSWSRHAQYFI